MRLPPLTLVLGGAASGKSAFAEKLVRQSGLAKVYVATAEAHDDEMRDKIAAHRADRAGQGWRTVEAPLDMARALAQLDPDEAALVDCVTFWLSNQMLSSADWTEEFDILSEVLVQLPAPVVLVSNEVGSGVVPDNALARRFRNAQGRTNQHLARLCDLVVQVTAGLPMVLKGQGPAGGAAWE